MSKIEPSLMKKTIKDYRWLLPQSSIKEKKDKKLKITEEGNKRDDNMNIDM